MDRTKVRYRYEMLTTIALGLLSAQVTISAGAVKAPAPTPPVAVRPKRDIVVQAGKYDRQDSLVEVALSPEDAHAGVNLKNDQGQLVPIQIDEKGRAWFVIKSMKAGSRARYRLGQDDVRKLAFAHR